MVKLSGFFLWQGNILIKNNLAYEYKHYQLQEGLEMQIQNHSQLLWRPNESPHEQLLRSTLIGKHDRLNVTD